MLAVILVEHLSTLLVGLFGEEPNVSTAGVKHHRHVLARGAYTPQHATTNRVNLELAEVFRVRFVLVLVQGFKVFFVCFVVYLRIHQRSSL